MLIEIVLALAVVIILLLILGSLFIFRSFAINERKEKHRELRPEPWGSLGRRLIEDEKWFHTLSPDELWMNKNGIKLHGWYVRGRKERTVILIHGWKDNAERRMDSARFYYERGWNIFIPDLRAHGKSDGKYVGMGVIERSDIIDWITLLSEKYGKTQVLLDGISMGAATTCALTGDFDLPACVKAAISDSAYTSIWELVPSLMDPMPNFIRPIIRIFAEMWCRIFAGYGFRQDEPINKVRHSKTPTLFIHGEEDHFVPFYMGKKMYDACCAPKEYWAAPKAGHILAWWLNQEEYERRLDSFINKYMPE